MCLARVCDDQGDHARAEEVLGAHSHGNNPVDAVDAALGLGRLAASQGRFEVAVRHDRKALALGRGQGDGARLRHVVALNNLSVHLREQGRSAEAVRIARRAVRISLVLERESGSAHWLVNLSLAHLVGGEYVSAERANSQAWGLRSTSPSLVIARVLATRTALALLAGGEYATYIGQLVTVLESARGKLTGIEVDRRWDVDSVLRALAPHLAPDAVILLQRMFSVLRRQNPVRGLQEIQQLKGAAGVSLEHPWPVLFSSP